MPIIADFANFSKSSTQAPTAVRTTQSQTISTARARYHTISQPVLTSQKCRKADTFMLYCMLYVYTQLIPINYLIASIRNWHLCMSMKNHLLLVSLSLSLSPAILHRSVPCAQECPVSGATMALVLSDHTLHR